MEKRGASQRVRPWQSEGDTKDSRYRQDAVVKKTSERIVCQSNWMMMVKLQSSR
jgi:hypothetical protein